MSECFDPSTLAVYHVTLEFVPDGPVWQFKSTMLNKIKALTLRCQTGNKPLSEAMILLHRIFAFGKHALCYLYISVKAVIKLGHWIINHPIDCVFISFWPSSTCKVFCVQARQVIMNDQHQYLYYNWYLPWKQRAWRYFYNTHHTFLALCIRWTDHLCDFCCLTDANPHFVLSPLPDDFKMHGCSTIVTS